MSELSFNDSVSLPSLGNLDSSDIDPIRNGPPAIVPPMRGAPAPATQDLSPELAAMLKDVLEHRDTVARLCVLNQLPPDPLTKESLPGLIHWLGIVLPSLVSVVVVGASVLS